MGDLKVGEGFIDAIVIRRTADNAHGTGLSPVCTVMKLSDGATVTPTVAELTLAVYKVTDWSPAVDTEYLTLWEIEVAGYTIHSAFKLFKVGGGRTEDIYDNLADVLAEVAGLNGAAMRGTDGAALASSWTASLATALSAYSAARAVYLDELDFALQEAITALQTDLDNPSQYMADLSTLETRISALRAGYLDQLDFALQEAIAALQTDLDNPGQYMADVSALALEATVDIVDGIVDDIKALVDSAEAVGPFSYLDAGGEQDVYEDTATTRRKINIEVSNRNMTLAGSFIIYRKVDGVNYDIWITQAVTVGAGDDRAWDAPEFTINQPWKISYTESADEGAARAIPYNVITQVIE